MALQAYLLKKNLKMSSVGTENYTIGSGMLRIPKIKIKIKKSLQKDLPSQSYDLRKFSPVWPKKTPPILA